MINSNELNNFFNSPIRKIGARTELFETMPYRIDWNFNDSDINWNKNALLIWNDNNSDSSILASTFTDQDDIKSITVERVGEEGKFFGFGICQKLNLHLIDTNRAYNLTTSNIIKIFLNGSDFAPNFKITEVHRQENTNELSITAYDSIYQASELRLDKVKIQPPYTIRQFTQAVGEALGLTVATGDVNTFDMMYEDGANFEGTESLREALDDIAEATQTIYYIDYQNRLVFKRLDKKGAAAYSISKDNYFELNSGENRRLGAICHATELGNNVIAESTFTGSTQYVRDNAFWELREDVKQLVENALTVMEGMTINQFDCKWRGNPLVEIGDKIAITTNDDDIINTFLLNDTLEYDGTLYQYTQWKYTDNEGETADNPTTLGDALKQTFSKVDKVNKRIDLVVKQTSEHSEEISQISANVGSIQATVEQVQRETSAEINGVTQNVDSLTERVNQSVTSNELKIEVEKIVEQGVNKIHTGTGYTFDSEGLKVSKSGSEMETQITDDGMKVFKDDVEVLTANNIGVNAKNLHATTYLIVGQNSRFEDYKGKTRTGCFWIG